MGVPVPYTTPSPDTDPEWFGKTSERDFAGQVRQLGGILPALAAGIDPWQLADGDVRSVWLELQRCWDQLKELTEEADAALTRAEQRPR